MKQGRTYRVPKKVIDQVKSGLRVYISGGMRVEDMYALEVAKVLTSDNPIDVSTAEQINSFFTHDWWFDAEKIRVAPLFGGDDGHAWALKCVVAAGLVAAGVPPATNWFDDMSDADAQELFTFTDDDVAQMLRYGENLSDGSGDELQGPDVGVVPAVADSAGTDVADTDAADVESTDMVPDAAAGVELFSDDELDDVVEGDMTVAAMREAVANATARFDGASVPASDGGVPAGGGGVPTGGSVAPAPVPSTGDGDNHADRQLRDYHGRFAKVGARVQGKGGNLGWVKGADGNGNAVVTLDDGSEVTVDPGEMQVVSVKGRAALAANPKTVDDPAARLDAYTEWAQEQLAGAV